MHTLAHRVIRFVATNERLIVAALMIVVIILGAAYSLLLTNRLRFPDEHDYRTLAINVIERQQYLDSEGLRAFRAPGYPLLLALFYAAGAPVVAWRAANFVALAGSILCTYAIVRAQASAFAAVIAGLMVCMYPVLFYTAGTLYPQTLAALLFLLILYVVLTKHTIGWFLLAGTMFGWLILTIPPFVTTFLTVLVWNAWAKRFTKGQVAAVVVSVALVVGAWSVRNYREFGSFVFISTNSGLNLLLGNSEHTTPNAGVNVDIARYTAKGSRFGEVERDNYYRSEAIKFMSEHKAHSARLYGLKFLNYFNYKNELYMQSESSRGRNLLVLVTYGPLLLLALLRLALVRRYPLTGTEILLYLLYLSSAAAGAVFFTRIRFRIPYDYLLIIIAAMLLGRVVQSWTGIIADVRRSTV